jgi:hypothetical protein
MDNSNKIISFAFDLDSKVVINHKQSDIQNLKHNVDILKSKSYDKTSILLQSVSEFHILVLPQLRMSIITKIISIYRSLHKVKPPCG